MATYLSGVWNTWCDATTALTASHALTTAATHNDGVWLTWTTSGTTANDLTAGSSAAMVWLTWTTAGDTANTILPGTVQLRPAPYVEARTREQIAADEARYAAQLAAEQQRIAEAAARHRAASARARALLLSMLEVHQREQLQRHRYFEVIARHSKRRYRIRQGTHGNVRLLDDQGREVTSYCGQPTGVPTEDCMLAQKLQIEHDEAAFLKVANASRVA